MVVVHHGRNTMARGRCYEQAFWFLMNWCTPQMVLCHGIARQDAPPHLYFGHAWIETGKRVIDVATGKPQRAWQWTYYRTGGIDAATVVRYTREEARQLVLKHRHFGPWDPRIAAAVHHREKSA
jgi:hypothetical protein